MYQVGDVVRFNSPRCACVGGGTQQLDGPVVGVLLRPNSKWYQIDQPSGIVVINESNIVKKIS